MNKGKYYVLPEGAKIEKTNVEMFKSGDGFAYQDEKIAEYSIAIGAMCECGNVIDSKYYTALLNAEKKSKMTNLILLKKLFGIIKHH